MLVIAGIMIYLAIRFEWRFAVSAIIANLHDIIIILGLFAILRLGIQPAGAGLVLAILGYSVNESVVIADRVRENFTQDAQGQRRSRHRQRDHQHHQPHHHHPRLDADHGARCCSSAAKRCTTSRWR